MTLVILIWTLALFSRECLGEVEVTQSPRVLHSEAGESVSISCSFNKSPDCCPYRVSWYQQKPGEAPKLLICDTNSRYSGTDSSFSGRGSNRDFSLSITEVQAEDAGHYYCQSYHSSDVFTQ
ncbi:hypothetical protein DNTS_002231 [Danionella cerebrum]|uniref:Ig-like domain-containing protein n=1 Tax=Danionella cerebrum TaxID=2873325 RepID=A0A553NGN7_9TELE|nr:hypothetical protein DNTS_002231 [Danionella translucida]